MSIKACVKRTVPLTLASSFGIFAACNLGTVTSHANQASKYCYASTYYDGCGSWDYSCVYAQARITYSKPNDTYTTYSYYGPNNSDGLSAVSEFTANSTWAIKTVANKWHIQCPNCGPFYGTEPGVVR